MRFGDCLVLLAMVPAACSVGAETNDVSLVGVGMSDGTDGNATAWDGETEDSTSDTGTVPADIDELDSSSSDDAPSQADEGGAGMSTGVAEGTDDGSSSSDGGAPVGDPQCPPGFVVAFDITDGEGDQMGQHTGWLSDILFDSSSRISFEIWSAGSDHYGPIIWDTSGYASAFDAFAAGAGPMTGIVSEDAGWRMSLAPSDTFVFVTAADDDPQVGDTHLFGWLAPRYTSNDEVFGINAPYPGAYVDRYESGDRWVACYDPNA